MELVDGLPAKSTQTAAASLNFEWISKAAQILLSNIDIAGKKTENFSNTNANHHTVGLTHSMRSSLEFQGAPTDQQSGALQISI